MESQTGMLMQGKHVTLRRYHGHHILPHAIDHAHDREMGSNKDEATAEKA